MLSDSKTLIEAEKAYVDNGGSFKAPLSPYLVPILFYTDDNHSFYDLQKTPIFSNLSSRKRLWPWPPFSVPSVSMGAGKEAALPKRFVFVVKSSGIDKFNLVPEGLKNHFINPEDGKKLGNRGRREGPLVDVALADQKLPEKLGALETFKDRLTIIQSLSGVGFRGNHTKGFGTLSLHDSEKVAICQWALPVSGLSARATSLHRSLSDVRNGDERATP